MHTEVDEPIAALVRSIRRAVHVDLVVDVPREQANLQLKGSKMANEMETF